MFRRIITQVKIIFLLLFIYLQVDQGEINYNFHDSNGAYSFKTFKDGVLSLIVLALLIVLSVHIIIDSRGKPTIQSTEIPVIDKVELVIEDIHFVFNQFDSDYYFTKAEISKYIDFKAFLVLENKPNKNKKIQNLSLTDQNITFTQTQKEINSIQLEKCNISMEIQGINTNKTKYFIQVFLRKLPQPENFEDGNNFISEQNAFINSLYFQVVFGTQLIKTYSPIVEAYTEQKKQDISLNSQSFVKYNFYVKKGKIKVQREFFSNSFDQQPQQLILEVNNKFYINYFNLKEGDMFSAINIEVNPIQQKIEISYPTIFILFAEISICFSIFRIFVQLLKIFKQKHFENQIYEQYIQPINQQENQQQPINQQENQQQSFEITADINYQQNNDSSMPINSQNSLENNRFLTSFYKKCIQKCKNSYLFQKFRERKRKNYEINERRRNFSQHISYHSILRNQINIFESNQNQI